VIDTALQFSGGKDSLACLYLNQHRWDQIYVVWVNTGAAYPETIEWMQQWKARLPHFVEVRSNQPQQVKECGWPVDLLPVNCAPFAPELGMKQSVRLQPYIGCCSANIWLPMRDATIGLGVSNIIRGQRAQDKRRNTLITNGFQHDGITYWLPIEHWSTKDVFAYLRQQSADLPPYYAKGELSSHDCWDCTAYLDENQQRIKNLPPEKKSVVLDRLCMIRSAVQKETKLLVDAIYG